ncbi:MAG: DUF1565 domain-containing protein [Myxococcales bacterium]|nr:DUF1565 domain-containing protein [Myxococcales bacterium]
MGPADGSGDGASSCAACADDAGACAGGSCPDGGDSDAGACDAGSCPTDGGEDSGTASDGGLGPGAVAPFVSLALRPTFRSVGVYSGYSGDPDDDAAASIDYRPAGGSAWRPAYPPYLDRGDRQARGSIVGLAPCSTYEVRVTYLDPGGVAGQNPVFGGVSTRCEQVPADNGNAFYVSPAGSDSAPGTQAQPFQTIRRALAGLQSGDSVYVRAGTYREQLQLATSGGPSGYVTLAGYPGETAVLDGNAGAIANLLTLSGADYVRIRSLTFQNAGASLIRVDNGSDHVLIENCILREPAYGVTSGNFFEGAVHLRGSSSDAVVRDNTFERTTVMTTKVDIKGIAYWRAGNGLIAYGNVFRGGFEDGIGGGPEDATGQTNDQDLYRNSFDGACFDDAIQIEGPNMNARLWENRIANCFMGIASAPNLKGPLYIFRNVLYRQSHPTRGPGGMTKLGDATTGRTYYFHNSFAAGAGVAADAHKQTNPDLANLVSRNNSLFSGRYVMEAPSIGPPFDLDFDLLYTSDASRFVKWTGSVLHGSLLAFRSATQQEANGIQADPSYRDAASGDLCLKAGAPGRDVGAVLPNFNDAASAWPSKGAGPDLGACEE